MLSMFDCHVSAYFLSLIIMKMASLNRGQPPAWHTKVVHQGPGCLKAGSKGEPTVVVMLCPQSLLMTDVVQSEVTSCGNKPCTHIVIGSTFRSNINGRVYSILDCSSKILWKVWNTICRQD